MHIDQNQKIRGNPPPFIKKKRFKNPPFNNDATRACKRRVYLKTPEEVILEVLQFTAQLSSSSSSSSIRDALSHYLQHHTTNESV